MGNVVRDEEFSSPDAVFVWQSSSYARHSQVLSVQLLLGTAADFSVNATNQTALLLQFAPEEEI